MRSHWSGLSGGLVRTQAERKLGIHAFGFDCNISNHYRGNLYYHSLMIVRSARSKPLPHVLSFLIFRFWHFGLKWKIKWVPNLSRFTVAMRPRLGDGLAAGLILAYKPIERKETTRLHYISQVSFKHKFLALYHFNYAGTSVHFPNLLLCLVLFLLVYVLFLSWRWWPIRKSCG